MKTTFASALNEIEHSITALGGVDDQISRLEAEISDLRSQYDGRLPRTEEQLRAAYSWLGDGLNAHDNPRNFADFSAELASRARYDELAGQIDTLRTGSASDAVAANDTIRSVIPDGQRWMFIWFMEALKAGAFFILGTSKISKPKAKAKASPDQPAEPAPERKPPTARQWAIIRSKQVKKDASPT